MALWSRLVGRSNDSGAVVPTHVRVRHAMAVVARMRERVLELAERTRTSPRTNGARTVVGAEAE